MFSESQRHPPPKGRAGEPGSYNNLIYSWLLEQYFRREGLLFPPSTDDPEAIFEKVRSFFGIYLVRVRVDPNSFRLEVLARASRVGCSVQELSKDSGYFERTKQPPLVDLYPNGAVGYTNAVFNQSSFSLPFNMLQQVRGVVVCAHLEREGWGVVATHTMELRVNSGGVAYCCNEDVRLEGG